MYVDNEHGMVINRKKLFIGSCVALTATSVAFAVIGDILFTLKASFVLTNLEVGYIGGAALWGFAISMIIFAPLCDTLGMRTLTRAAFFSHVLGVVIMMTATGFWQLFIGALIISIGNGLVEAALNPLVATLYPKNKTVRLNQFHVWFPGGIVIGGLLSFGLTTLDLGHLWQLKLAIILIPTVIYGWMMLRETFPATENIQSGVQFKEMFKVTFTTPLFLVMLFCIMLTASLELGPNRWIPAVLEAGGIPGILVLVWISGLMAVLRYYAGPVIHRLSPTGLLLVSCFITGIGLFLFSFSETIWSAFIFATIFAVGVCYIWPTILGFVSERVPKSGALGLGLIGGTGMAIVGLITTPQMGNIADRYVHDVLSQEETVYVLEQSRDTFTGFQDTVEEEFAMDIENALQLAGGVLYQVEQRGSLPEIETMNALRAITGLRPVFEAEGLTDQTVKIVERASELLGPADNYGGRMSFRVIAPLSVVLVIIFGTLYIRDRRAGGYKVEHIRPDILAEEDQQSANTGH